ncbi:hypothetical protein [Methylobacterium sp. AMS5]|uniref:hypothetical protein n=1 Tax=Methylobacterium sp. AMS5 TaxID=925818 RepID=UPI00074F98A2|nr:hypothetical protein [Methylobacterium sp. AMS5]AMB48283.1 hypothetical protein Y590_25280 [Methylobacterium sp. AMS5]
MRFPANCILVALVCGGTRMRFQRNRFGRYHAFWRTRDGLAWNFTARDRARRGYLANALYLGSIKRLPSQDRLVRTCQSVVTSHA